MDITQAFPSNFLKADDLQGQTRTVNIESVAMEEVAPGESKPVLRFVGVPKGLVLNKTNTTTIVSAYGKETTTWAGKALMLFASTVSFQGRMVPAIRVAATQAGQPAVQESSQPEPVQQEIETAAPATAQAPNDPVPW